MIIKFIAKDFLETRLNYPCIPNIKDTVLRKVCGKHQLYVVNAIKHDLDKDEIRIFLNRIKIKE